jgi:hypothetical protein
MTGQARFFCRVLDGDQLRHEVYVVPRLAIALEPIPDAKNGLDVRIPVREQLLSEAANMNIQRASPNIFSVSPDTFQQDLTRDDLSGIVYEQREQFVFLASENDLPQINKGRSITVILTLILRGRREKVVRSL